MGALINNKFAFGVVAAFAVLATACTRGTDSVTVEGDVPIAYVKRPAATLGNPTDAITFTAGGDLYILDKSSPSAQEQNVTGSYTLGAGDVSDPEVSYDGRRILFAMRCGQTSAPECYRVDGQPDGTWNIWEYDTDRKTLTRIIRDSAVSSLGDDVDPVYLPDGRIVFVSDRQETSKRLMVAKGDVAAGQEFSYLDEYEREQVTALHIIENDRSTVRQISYNQSHDRNPTVLQSGEIMYSRWDHVGMRNQFSIFKTNPDGTNLFVHYGAHSPGNSFLHPREMPNGKVMSSLMPLSGTREGGALMVIDVENFSEDNEPGPGAPAGGRGQVQASADTIPLGRELSTKGRYSTPYPLWDGTNRALVTWTPSQPVSRTNAVTGNAETVEGTPVYGVYMFNLNDKTLRPVVLAPAGYAVLDAVALQSRPTPAIVTDKTLDAGMIARNVGILNVKSVYDTDRLGRMGANVLVSGESIPTAGGVADVVRLKDPAQTAAAQRPARFVRITRAVPTPPGISRMAIGETEFEMQQILGYAEIEPDGSFKLEVPADTPLGITAIDANGRGFTPHTSWVQVRPGETRTCNGCHSPRRGNAINLGISAADLDAASGNYFHPNTGIALSPALNPVGQSMAESRSLLDNSKLNLNAHMLYTDVWTDQTKAGRAPDAALTISYAGLTTAAPVNGVINYQDHIEPLWSKNRGASTCTACHNNNDPNNPVSVGLDLTAGVGGSGRARSYDELMIGDPVLDPVTGLPQVRVRENQLEVVREEPQVTEGQSRASHLVEVLFNQELRSARALGPTNHSVMMNASEKRLVSEWADLGGQYFNSPRDSGGNLRGVAGLSENAFETDVHPILVARCAGCHQPFGSNGTSAGPAGPTAPTEQVFVSNRFVLTGNARGDFNVTASMVTDKLNPANSYLLSRPSTIGVAGDLIVHPPVPGSAPPAVVLPTTDPDYRTICNWIQAGSC